MSIEKIPPTSLQEVLPPARLPSVEVCSIDRQMEIIEEEIRGGKFRLNAETYELGPLRKAKKEGYRYILYLPKENDAALKIKYGQFFFAMKAYFAFIETLAKRNNIRDFFHIYDHYYVFKNEEDAKKLSVLVADAQKTAVLEFETIEGEKEE